MTITKADLTPIIYEIRGISDLKPIKIEIRHQRDKTDKWVVSRDGSMVMNRGGEWEYEMLPSNREKDFMARTRFKSVDEALQFLNEFLSNNKRQVIVKE